MVIEAAADLNLVDDDGDDVALVLSSGVSVGVAVVFDEVVFALVVFEVVFAVVLACAEVGVAIEPSNVVKPIVLPSPGEEAVTNTISVSVTSLLSCARAWTWASRRMPR